MTRSEEKISTVINALLKLMSHIPYPLGQFLGRMLGTAASFLPIDRMKVSLNNMRDCLGDELGENELRRLNRQMFRHFGRMVFEVPHVLKISPDNLDQFVTFENEGYLREALSLGKGCLILSAHFGNWEMMCASFPLHFGKLSIVVRPVDFPPLDRVLSALRTRFGSEIIPKQRGARHIMQDLRKGRPVAILLDQNVDWYEGVFVDFLGKTACTNKGLALIALKTGAPVVPAFTVRRNDGGYRLVLEKPLLPRITGDKIRDIEENTALYASTITGIIRKYPDQWFWFHRRWKTRNYCPLSECQGEVH
jgi:KDO2-lipid IV(A) lauroyltransferase